MSGNGNPLSGMIRESSNQSEANIRCLAELERY